MDTEFRGCQWSFLWSSLCLYLQVLAKPTSMYNFFWLKPDEVTSGENGTEKGIKLSIVRNHTHAHAQLSIPNTFRLLTSLQKIWELKTGKNIEYFCFLQCSFTWSWIELKLFEVPDWLVMNSLYSCFYIFRQLFNKVQVKEILEGSLKILVLFSLLF